jgi:murein DD-endopeptidase MepM/ murein hydrolase activator NlpD
VLPGYVRSVRPSSNSPVTLIYRTFATGTLGAALFIGAALLSAHATVNSSESIELRPPAPKQGETLSLRIMLPAGDTPPAVSFENKMYKLYPEMERRDGVIGYRALIGVPADIAAGVHKLKIGADERDVVVKSGGFSVQKIHLPPGKDNFISSPGEEDAVKEAKATASEKQFWTGLFIPPSNARMSSRFGNRRSVNGHLLTDYFHSGVDYAGGLGAPVSATQKGRVIIAHNGWRLHGNTIAIDHGQGVVSFYIHLSKILVKTGQMVEPGQLIGKIGTTGRANGPHLHFSVYVNGDATNPLDWFARSM